MAASQEEPMYTYPDPSLLGLNVLANPQDPPLERHIEFSTNLPIPVVNPPAPRFIIDPALLELHRLATRPLAHTTAMAMAPTPASAPGHYSVVPAPVPVAFPVPAPVVPAPAPAQAPNPGNIPAARPSAAGLQPFPELIRGLQAPIELTEPRDITLWNKKLEGNIPSNNVLKG